MSQRARMFWIRFPYYLGIVADALWAIALFFPNVYGVMTSNPGFDPNLETRLIMGIGGSLMTGWTVLLAWGVIKPLERRMVILITAFPVVFGMFVIATIGVIKGETSGLWLVLKTLFLLVTMVISFILAGIEHRRS